MSGRLLRLLLELAHDDVALETRQEVDDQPASPATLFGAPPAPVTASRDIEPPEWAPWSFLSAGTVIILYALTINRGG